jgi:hypothetical protein
MAWQALDARGIGTYENGRDESVSRRRHRRLRGAFRPADGQVRESDRWRLNGVDNLVEVQGRVGIDLYSPAPGRDHWPDTGHSERSEE